MVRTLDQTKRAAIIDAAKAIFKKDGYTAAKMADIAAASNVAPGTLYLYFENKDALANAIGEEFFATKMSKFDSLFRELEDPEGVVALIDWAVQISETERDVLVLAKERAKSKNNPKHHRMVEGFAETLSSLAERKIIRRYSNYKIQAELLMAVMRRIIMSDVIFADETITELRLGAIETLQHALFDDVTLTAHQMLKRSNKK